MTPHQFKEGEKPKTIPILLRLNSPPTLPNIVTASKPPSTETTSEQLECKYTFEYHQKNALYAIE